LPARASRRRSARTLPPRRPPPLPQPPAQSADAGEQTRSDGGSSAKHGTAEEDWQESIPDGVSVGLSVLAPAGWSAPAVAEALRRHGIAVSYCEPAPELRADQGAEPSGCEYCADVEGSAAVRRLLAATSAIDVGGGGEEHERRLMRGEGDWQDLMLYIPPLPPPPEPEPAATAPAAPAAPPPPEPPQPPPQPAPPPAAPQPAQPPAKDGAWPEAADGEELTLSLLVAAGKSAGGVLRALKKNQISAHSAAPAPELRGAAATGCEFTAVVRGAPAVRRLLAATAKRDAASVGAHDEHERWLMRGEGDWRSILAYAGPLPPPPPPLLFHYNVGAPSAWPPLMLAQVLKSKGCQVISCTHAVDRHTGCPRMGRFLLTTRGPAGASYTGDAKTLRRLRSQGLALTLTPVKQAKRAGDGSAAMVRAGAAAEAAAAAAAIVLTPSTPAPTPPQALAAPAPAAPVAPPPPPLPHPPALSSDVAAAVDADDGTQSDDGSSSNADDETQSDDGSSSSLGSDDEYWQELAADGVPAWLDVLAPAGWSAPAVAEALGRYGIAVLSCALAPELRANQGAEPSGCEYSAEVEGGAAVRHLLAATHAIDAHDEHERRLMRGEGDWRSLLAYAVLLPPPPPKPGPEATEPSAPAAPPPVQTQPPAPSSDAAAAADTDDEALSDDGNSSGGSNGGDHGSDEENWKFCVADGVRVVLGVLAPSGWSAPSVAEALGRHGIAALSCDLAPELRAAAEEPFPPNGCEYRAEVEGSAAVRRLLAATFVVDERPGPEDGDDRERRLMRGEGGWRDILLYVPPLPEPPEPEPAATDPPQPPPAQPAQPPSLPGPAAAVAPKPAAAAVVPTPQQPPVPTPLQAPAATGPAVPVAPPLPPSPPSPTPQSPSVPAPAAAGGPPPPPLPQPPAQSADAGEPTRSDDGSSANRAITEE